MSHTITVSHLSPYHKPLVALKSATVSTGVILRKVGEMKDGSVLAVLGYPLAGCVTRLDFNERPYNYKRRKTLFNRVYKATLAL